MAKHKISNEKTNKTKHSRYIDITELVSRLKPSISFRICDIEIPSPVRSQIFANRTETRPGFVLNEAFRLIGLSTDTNDSSEFPPISYSIYDEASVPLDEASIPLITILKNNPGWMFTDSVVQLSIALLRGDCINGTGKEATRARKILELAGLKAFVPRDFKYKRTDDPTLRYFQMVPLVLVAYVWLYESVVRDFLKRPYSRSERDRKMEDIKMAFDKIYKNPMPDNLISRERDKDAKAIALAFVSYERKIPYESLRKFYYYKKVSHLPKEDAIEYLKSKPVFKEHLKEYIDRIIIEIK